jgi:hypothetical protein
LSTVVLVQLRTDIETVVTCHYGLSFHSCFHFQEQIIRNKTLFASVCGFLPACPADWSVFLLPYHIFWQVKFSICNVIIVQELILFLLCRKANHRKGDNYRKCVGVNRSSSDRGYTTLHAMDCTADRGRSTSRTDKWPRQCTIIVTKGTIMWLVYGLLLILPLSQFVGQTRAGEFSFVYFFSLGGGEFF